MGVNMNTYTNYKQTKEMTTVLEAELCHTHTHMSIIYQRHRIWADGMNITLHAEKLYLLLANDSG